MARKLKLAAGRALSTDLERAETVPYFLWDEPMTVAELRTRLRVASVPEWARLLAKIMREARDTRVSIWKRQLPRQ